MTFEHNGVRYRIGFKHDKSRELEAHVGHDVTIERLRDEQGPLPAILWCVQCDTRLAPIFRDDRGRNVDCTIWKQEGWGVIEEKQYPHWFEIAHGRSRLNWRAGDEYDREKGRVAALRAALNPTEKEIQAGAVRPDIAFRTALWNWFLHGRKRSAVERAAVKAGR